MAVLRQGVSIRQGATSERACTCNHGNFSDVVKLVYTCIHENYTIHRLLRGFNRFIFIHLVAHTQITRGWVSGTTSRTEPRFLLNLV